jgi:hypothetical protein
VLTVLPAAPALPEAIGRDDSDTVQVVGGGGPLITLSSNHGNVLLYGGSLADRRPAELSAPWQTMYDLLAADRHPAWRKPAFHPSATRPPQARAPRARPSPWSR